MTKATEIETSYVYRQVTGEGDVNSIYSSYYDNRKASLSDLDEREKDIYLATYFIPKRPGKFYTLHRLSGGDTTFVYEPWLDLSPENPVAALYLEDLEEGTEFTSHREIISLVLESMEKTGVTPADLFADDPEWIEYQK